MYFLITPRRFLGVALTKEELRRTPPIRGDIHIYECQNEELGRAAFSAWVFNPGPGPDILPRLHDVKITGMAQRGMNLNGIEQIGDALADSTGRSNTGLLNRF
ncbi:MULTISPECIES: hypothetical protein [Pseudomonas]|uniref:hypothetical protein n=1 Tax=Pseudomonas TaxID=286 RepID=UPI0006898C69|nr:MULTISPECIES: hypothetical protein [Pseudomonas]PWY36664.1 hypothetical protein DK261_29750 [Pseudomonas sp. RW409]QHC88765.1 hypothetical protein PchlR47_10740 [Pseudomonas chlororaphis]